ncbi:vitamin K epoxide reductase family protein [Actinomyces faecalis]|uniref:vitamin K epoxide reductase family protein n=1 Tax=Actinomyces faecalis TaxID=2722820 RepID=UPI0015572986|nr:vitamin K epoxide reductase family protein [Actinomyces faecalis]
MARIPTEAEIDAMSEDELQAYLASAQDRDVQAVAAQGGTAGAEDVAAWLRATGSSRSYALLLIVAGLIGIAASWELMASELKVLREPLADLTCDINPLVSCAGTLDMWQGNLLGVPNSFIGAMAFAVLLVLGLALASGVQLPRWMWWGVVAGTVCAVVLVAWFLGVSVLTFGKLCPLCLVIWAVTILTAASTWGEAALRGHLGLPEPAARRLSQARWWVAGAMYVIVVAVILIAFWDGWAALLR